MYSDSDILDLIEIYEQKRDYANSLGWYEEATCYQETIDRLIFDMSYSFSQQLRNPGRYDFVFL